VNSKQIEVAVVGAGSVANEAHLPGWRRIRGTKIVAICDANRQAAENAALRWRVPYYYTNLSDLLNSEKPTLVDICTPPTSHLPLISQALAAGCHIIIEKPLAMTSEESQKILDLYLSRTNKDIKFGVLYNWLFHPQVLALMQLITNGAVGDILNVEIKCFHPKNESMISNPNHWCHTISGGRFGEVLIHPIYLLYRLLGNLETSDPHLAKRGSYSWVHYDELQVNLKAERGFGNIYISFNSPGLEFPVITVYGTKAQLNFNGRNLNLTIRRPANRTDIFSRGADSLGQIGQITKSLTSNVMQTITGRHRTSHQVFFQLFVDCINGKGDLPLTIEEASETNRILLNLLRRIPDMYQ
jgi:predicted dehydrogenase